MQIKILELRDRGTYIGLLCVDMNPDNQAQKYHMRRVGYACDGNPNIGITRVAADGTDFSNDYYHWCDRTFKVGHEYIIANWFDLKDGDVIDVEWILGETTEKKKSEREANAMKELAVPSELSDAEWEELGEKFPLWKVFDEVEDEFGSERSTEFLIAIVCSKEDVEYEDVIGDIAGCSEEYERKLAEKKKDTP